MKKLIYFAICVLFFVSCASKPKNNLGDDVIDNPIENSENDKNEEISTDAQTSSNDNEVISTDAQSPVIKTSESSNSDDANSDEMNLEKIEADKLPELAESFEDVFEKDETENSDSANVSSDAESPENDGNKEISPTTQSPENSDSTEISSNVETTENADNEEIESATESPENNDSENISSNVDTTEKDGNEEISSTAESPDNTERESLENIPIVRVPSRSMRIKKNQQIEVVYPGKGWIYQENIDENGNSDLRNKNFIFGGRKLGGQNQAFTLRARNAGTYLLHFFKSDALTESYIDDYLEVIVDDETTNSTTILTAPSYESVVPSKPKDYMPPKIETEVDNAILPDVQDESMVLHDSPMENHQTVSDSSEILENDTVKSVGNENISSSSPLHSETDEQYSNIDFLANAKKLFDEKQFEKANDELQRFLNNSADRTDEALFLQGQILEAKSPIQNIKGAIDSYDLLIKNYPTSKFWNAANKRSIYLKRFYVEIR